MTSNVIHRMFEAKKERNKLPPAIECPACKELGFMMFVEVTERLHSWNEEKGMFEYTGTSRFNIMRCVSCDKEVDV